MYAAIETKHSGGEGTLSTCHGRAVPPHSLVFSLFTPPSALLFVLSSSMCVCVCEPPGVWLSLFPPAANHLLTFRCSTVKFVEACLHHHTQFG